MERNNCTEVVYIFNFTSNFDGHGKGDQQLFSVYMYIILQAKVVKKGTQKNNLGLGLTILYHRTTYVLRTGADSDPAS